LSACGQCGADKRKCKCAKAEKFGHLIATAVAIILIYHNYQVL